MIARWLAVAACATALTAPPRRATAPRRGVAVKSTPEEVAIAASTQLLSLGAVAVVEGVWSTVTFGISAGRALQCLAPAVAAAGVLVASSDAVSSGVPETMGPGLAASSAAALGLLASYGLRLSEKQAGGEGEDPPKEVIGLFFVLAFFGLSTALQSFFAAGIATVPSLPTLPGFGGGDMLPDDLGL